MNKKKKFCGISLLLIVSITLIILIIPAPALATVTTTRDLPSEVGTAGEFSVSITASGFGAFGKVIETLPANFTYVEGSATPVTGIAEAILVEEDGQEVSFMFLCEEDTVNFTYQVTAPATDGGFYSFDGTLYDFNKTPHTIAGDTEINLTDSLVSSSANTAATTGSAANDQTGSTNPSTAGETNVSTATGGDSSSSSSAAAPPAGTTSTGEKWFGLSVPVVIGIIALDILLAIVALSLLKRRRAGY